MLSALLKTSTLKWDAQMRMAIKKLAFYWGQSFYNLAEVNNNGACPNLTILNIVANVKLDTRNWMLI